MNLQSLSKCLVSSALLLTIFTNPASAEYVFTAPPRETAQQGAVLYGEIVKELSRIMQDEVKYVHPKNWMKYKKLLKSGKADFVFDGPHFVAWRISNLDVKPIVRLPGKLSFVLVADKNNRMIKDKESLITRKICALPSPHLGTLSTYSMFPNQVRQPRFVASKGGFKSVMKAYKAGKCDAAILRDGFFYNKLDKETRSNLRIVAQSESLTNQGITVSKRVNLDKQQQISNYLMSSDGQVTAKKLFHRFSKKKPNFIAANSTDYDGQNLLKQNMIFGW